MGREINFEYGFRDKDSIIKRVYGIDEIPNIKSFCALWGNLEVAYIRQFTGMYDKNNNPIYEGDVVELENFHPLEYEVIFENGCFMFYRDLKDGQKPFRYQMKFCTAAKVIGNIYEHF